MAMNTGPGGSGRPSWLTIGFGLVAVALVFVPLAALGIGQRADRMAGNIVEELDPLARSVDRVHIDVLALVAEGNRYALQEGAASRDRYDQIRARYDLNAARLTRAAAGTDFQVEAASVLLLAQDVARGTDRGVDARAQDPATVQSELVWAARPALQDFTNAASILQRDLETDIRDAQDRYRGLESVELAISVLASLTGGVALIALLGIERSRRRLLTDSERERGRFIGMVEATGFGVLQVGPDGGIEYVNPAGAQLLGYDVRELERLPGEAVFGSDGTAEAGIATEPPATLAEALRRGESYYGREEFMARGGAAVPVQVGSAPMRRASGSSGFVLVFEDLAPRLEREQSVQEFLALASHELRSPLTSIVGFGRRLARRARNGGGLDEEAAEELDTVAQEGERMRRTVELFLDMSRLDANVLTVESEPIELRHLLLEVVASQRDRFPNVDFDETYPAEGAIVEADEQRVRQVVTNLLDNAVKYGGRPPRVHIEVTPEGEGVVVSVRDNGEGIAPDDLEHIFDRFYRGRASSSGRKGLGLGLYLSRRLAEHMGARLHATSQPGQGSEFRLWLPVQATPDGRRRQRSWEGASSLNWSTRT